MGSEIHGIISHSLTHPPPINLPEELDKIVRSGTPFTKGAWAWKDDCQQNSNRWILVGEGRPNVRIAYNAAEISTDVGWFEASQDKKLRRSIVLGIFELASFFDSCGVILLPDDEDPYFSIRQTIYDENASFEDVLQKLEKVKNPCQTFQDAIQYNNGGRIDGYIVVQKPFIESALLV